MDIRSKKYGHSQDASNPSPARAMRTRYSRDPRTTADTVHADPSSFVTAPSR
jgi:hypothetical protein